MKISLDNGKTLKSFDQLTGDDPLWIFDNWNVVVFHMEPNAMAEVVKELAHCGRLEFLQRYLQLAPRDLVL